MKNKSTYHESFDRRRFLGALGAGAVGALTGCAAGGGTADETPGIARATAVNHIAYAVVDYARTRDFYVEMFGMRVAWDDGTKCSVEFGDTAKPDAFYLTPAKPGEKAYVNHIGYSIHDFPGRRAAIEAELKRRNLKFQADTEQGWTLQDPSGFTIHFISETGIFPGAAAPCKVMASAECRTANEVGLRNLARAPKASGRGFKAVAFSHIVQCVRNIDETRDFYRDLFGMREVYSTREGANPQTALRFGRNTLVLTESRRPDRSPYIDHIALEIDGYETARVESELKRRGYSPQAQSKLGWSIQDPEGLRVEVAGRNWPAHTA